MVSDQIRAAPGVRQDKEHDWCPTSLGRRQDGVLCIFHRFFVCQAQLRGRCSSWCQTRYQPLLVSDQIRSTTGVRPVWAAGRMECSTFFIGFLGSVLQVPLLRGMMQPGTFHSAQASLMLSSQAFSQHVLWHAEACGCLMQPGTFHSAQASLMLSG
jgi:hypothetical protein